MQHNRKFLLSLLVLGFLLSCTLIPQQITDAEIPQQILKEVRNATVYINTTVSGGSGFFVTHDKIVTNMHIIAGAESIHVVVPSISAIGTEYVVYNIEEIIGWNPKHDLVILQIPEGERGTPLPFGNVKEGDPVLAAGYPNHKYEVVQGMVHSIRSNKQLVLTSVNFPRFEESSLSPGNSGGPVLNLKGEVIGIAIMGDSVFSYAAPSDELRVMLSGPKLSLDKWQQKKSVRAYTSFTRGEWNEGNKAIEHYNEAIDLYPFATAYRKRGVARVNFDNTKLKNEDLRKLYEAATNDFNQAIKYISDDHTAYHGRGQAKLSLGQLAAEVNEKEEAIEYYNSAINDFSQVIGFISDHVEAYKKRGVANFRLSELVSDQGNIKKAQEHYTAAISDFGEIIKRKPNPTAYLNRGAANFKLGELLENHEGMKKAEKHYTSAIQDFNEAIGRDPNYVSAYRYRGVARQKIGQQKEAHADFNTADRLEPVWGN